MIKNISLTIILALLGFAAVAADLKVGDPAPTFTLQTQKDEKFDFQSRSGQWTVLYFYPKAETPGCTKQACAFRDGIDKIHALKAEVYGISINSVQEQSDFTRNHQLNFVLLADTDAHVTNAYGVKMPILKMAKRWTFIVGPDMKIAYINKDVDPVKDADVVVAELKKMQATK